MSALIAPELVALDADLGPDKHDVIRALAQRVADSGRATDLDALVADALAREEVSATGLPGGLAIPHCRTSGVDEPVVAFARLSPPVDFGGKDGPADLAFLIGAPAGGDATHLTILTKLARALARPEFGQTLRETDSAEQAAQTILEAVGDVPAPAKSTTPEPAPASAPTEKRSLVAVTACPTGIAHTYMAAEALEAAAARAGVEIAVETQGSAGATPLPAETIARADAAIFAVDVGVRDRGRFAGKPLVSSGVKRPIDDADAMIAEALAAAADPSSARVESGRGDSSESTSTTSESWGGRTRRILMTGVSYMIPFVAAGGLLIALSFLLGGYDITDVYGAVMVDNTLTNL
ncbi:MAG: fructose PTS transporter subunit IIB, partial [Actinomycetota bacterium]|nr:fructose PTS transporter subunit IIB [Actinomycetota bacterium]